MPVLHLVRHGRSLPVPGLPAHEWELDPAGFDDVWALRESGRLPEAAVWFCSPEPKAIGTSQLLAAALDGTPPDLDRWERMAMPDIIDVPLPAPGAPSDMLAP